MVSIHKLQTLYTHKKCKTSAFGFLGCETHSSSTSWRNTSNCFGFIPYPLGFLLERINIWHHSPLLCYHSLLQLNHMLLNHLWAEVHTQLHFTLHRSCSLSSLALLTPWELFLNLFLERGQGGKHTHTQTQSHIARNYSYYMYYCFPSTSELHPLQTNLNFLAGMCEEVWCTQPSED